MRTARSLPFTGVFTAVICILVFSGCASTPPKQLIANEKLLAAAGFKRYPADTPTKLARLNKFPQQKLFSRTDGGVKYYIYADAQHCKCLFKGGREEYERYQQLVLDHQLAQDRKTNEQRDRTRNLDWGNWRFRDNW